MYSHYLTFSTHYTFFLMMSETNRPIIFNILPFISQIFKINIRTGPRTGTSTIFIIFDRRITS